MMNRYRIVWLWSIRKSSTDALSAHCQSSKNKTIGCSGLQIDSKKARMTSFASCDVPSVFYVDFAEYAIIISLQTLPRDTK